MASTSGRIVTPHLAAPRDLGDERGAPGGADQDDRDSEQVLAAKVPVLALGGSALGGLAPAAARPPGTPPRRRPPCGETTPGRAHATASGDSSCHRAGTGGSWTIAQDRE